MLAINGIRCACSEKPIELCLFLERELAEAITARDLSRRVADSCIQARNQAANERDTARAEIEKMTAELHEAMEAALAKQIQP